MRKFWFLAAAALMGVTTAAHVFLGGAEINTPIREGSLPDEVKATASVVWHMVSLVLCLMTGGLAVLSVRENSALWAGLLIANLGFAVLFISFSLADLDALMGLPQWTAFAVVAAMMLFARQSA